MSKQDDDIQMLYEWWLRNGERKVIEGQERDELMTTKVVHVNSEEWKNTPEDQRVYIGRANPRRGVKGSKWANGFKIGADMTREQAIAAYRAWVSNPIILASLEELRGKTLGCWCKPEACHGDVLVELLGE